MAEKRINEHELIEVLKNGPLHSGEALLVANGKTIRIGIQGLQLNDSFDAAYTTITIDAFCFSDPKELAELVYGGW